MRAPRVLLITFCLIFGFIEGIQAQRLAIGEWQSHFSYVSAKRIVQADRRVFCATYNGLFSIPLDGTDTRTYSRINGLSDTGVSAMAYHEESKTLVVAYRNGNIDLLGLDENDEISEISNVPSIYNSTDLPASKSVSRIRIRDGMAYLATNFGVVVLDIAQQDIRETYRYIGTEGAELKINDLAFSTDSIHVATPLGVRSASMGSAVNRQYFASWKASAFSGSVVSLSVVDNSLFAGVPGKGIYVRRNGKWETALVSLSNSFNMSNSSSQLIATVGDRIVSIPVSGQPATFTSPLFSKLNDAIQTSDNTLWAADQSNGLLVFRSGTFTEVSPISGDTTIAPRADSVITDLIGQTWSILPRSRGGGISVVNKQTGVQKVLSTNTGSGSLPSENIRSLSLDHDGLIWFASDKGVGYFVPEDVMSGNRVDAILPIYGQRKLLSSEVCTAIVTEPGNRKWIGTNKGLYLFSADGTELVSRYDRSNSPLPSDQATRLKFAADDGTLFVDTALGMMSYQSDAISADEKLTTITIYPNPVLPGYGGFLGMKGFTNNATIKITTLAGRLVYETVSQGGSASWNLIDYAGRRAAGGIFLVFASDNTGERMVAKFAIIN